MQESRSETMRSEDLACAETAVGRIAMNLRVGNIRDLRFKGGSRELSPLHKAPWVDALDTDSDGGVPPVERWLSGDFFCAPFGKVDGFPLHGWTANSRWRLEDASEGSLKLALERSVLGARITKNITLARDAPVLYQEHLIFGGCGALSAAHHPMVCLSGTGRLSMSPKSIVLSGAAPEPGRNRLAEHSKTQDPARFPASETGKVDLKQLPIGEGSEDFVLMVERTGYGLGWSAVVRDVEDDVVFVLKDPRALPVTMFWHSNGGRDRPPWNGRHKYVLGIEDGRTSGAAGLTPASGRNPVSDLGIPTSFRLEARTVHRIPQVIGAIARPPGWSIVHGIEIIDDRLYVLGDSGEVVSMPFDTDFFKAPTTRRQGTGT